MNFGPHHAKAPVTNATHVKPNVDNINDGFLDISEQIWEKEEEFLEEKKKQTN